jgi:hypothetical protein
MDKRYTGSKSLICTSESRPAGSGEECEGAGIPAQICKRRCAPCHPLETLEEVEGYTLLRTYRNGWIEIMMDGEQMWVEMEKR